MKFEPFRTCTTLDEFRLWVKANSKHVQDLNYLAQRQKHFKIAINSFQVKIKWKTCKKSTYLFWSHYFGDCGLKMRCLRLCCHCRGDDPFPVTKVSLAVLSCYMLGPDFWSDLLNNSQDEVFFHHLRYDVIDLESK